MAKKANTTNITNIWMVTREYDGLAEAGGVKDVCRQLSEALVRAGKSVTVVLPCYGFIAPIAAGFKKTDLVFDVDLDYTLQRRRETVTVWQATRQGVRILLLDADRFREKQSVYTYTMADETADFTHRQGDGHFDYFAMNILLQKAALNLMILLQERPHIIHGQDGHTAILPAIARESAGYRQYFRNTGLLVTIHNAGIGYHQEVGDLAFAQAASGLPSQVINNNLLDGKFDPFIAASSYAQLNTVSENYARELQETGDDALTGWLGHHLLARGIKITGITNGINPEIFDPENPGALGLPAAYRPGTDNQEGKRACRQELCRRLQAGNISGLLQAGHLDYNPAQPLFTMISRLMVQKGLDILIQALAELLEQDPEFQVVILGTGSAEIEQALANLAATPRYLGRICLLRGYHAALANLVFAAGDFFLIPSRYEPCGLTDYIAQLAGSIPVVHHVGGLVKVVDNKTGFAFKEYTPQALARAMTRAMTIFRDNPGKIIRIQQQALARIRDRYTWDKVLQHYLALYQAAIPRTKSV